MNPINKTFTLGTQQVTLETGEIARQAPEMQARYYAYIARHHSGKVRRATDHADALPP